MIDETQDKSFAGTARAEDNSGATVAYCQQCGRPLTATSQRTVGSAVLCELCVTLRRTQAPGWTPVAGTSTAFAANPAAGTEPNPVLAGFLGLIPGVGAMYNGQYAKGVIHLIVFVVLVSLADNLNWVLWWFVWGWVFYQGFEAYHTALARRDGMPLPDPFGWNELGDRLGFGRGWPNGPAPASRPAAPTPFPAPFPGPPASYTPASAPFAASDSLAAQTVSANPYTAPFVAPAGPAVAQPVPPPPGSYSAPDAAPYVPTYTGTAPTGPAAAAPLPGQSVVIVGKRHFPAGAAWLIGLGILFLLGNIAPAWRLSGRWLVPILLAAIALWMAGTRILALRDNRGTLTATGVQRNAASLLLGPVILLTIAALLTLQDASLIPLRHSWPAVLIVWGALLLLSRAVPEAPPILQAAAADPGQPVTVSAGQEVSTR